MEGNDPLSSVTETNAITFALIAKHLLPKSKVESINHLLRNVLTEEMSPPNVLKEISHLLEDEQTVNMVWQTLIDRKGIRMTPLYNEISQIVDKFLQANIPTVHIISFLSSIIYSAKHGLKNVDLIKIILSFRFLVQYKDITMPYLISYGLRIASRITPIHDFTSQNSF